MIAFAVWTACAPSATPVDSPPEGTEPVPPDPQPWTFEVEERSDAVDLPALEAAFDQAVVDLLAYDADDVIEAYLDRLETSRTANCPSTVSDPDGNEYWLTGCLADDGTVFSGFLFHFVQAALPSGGFVLTGDSVSGNARVVGPEGQAIDIQGDVSVLSGPAVDGSSTIVLATLDGGFGVDDATTGWLAEGPRSVDIDLLGLTFEAFPGTLVQVTGAITTTRPDGTYAFEFAGNTVATRALSECPDEPGGTIAVRDPEGRWVDVTFDGPIIDVTGGNPNACDGCGTATLGGDEIGLVCADFTPWLSWEKLP